jgi:hypothetical protein
MDSPGFNDSRVQMAHHAQCGCGAVRLKLHAAPQLNFHCWCDQCRCGALHCWHKGGEHNITPLTDLGGVQNTLYRCDHVSVEEGAAEHLTAVSSRRGVDGFNPTRFYCAACSSYICLVPFPGAVLLNSVLCDNPGSARMFTDIAKSAAPGRVKAKLEAKHGGDPTKVIDDGMPPAFLDVILPLRPGQLPPDVQSSCPELTTVVPGTPAESVFLRGDFTTTDIHDLARWKSPIISAAELQQSMMAGGSGRGDDAALSSPLIFEVTWLATSMPNGCRETPEEAHLSLLGSQSADEHLQGPRIEGARHMDVQTHLSCPYGTAPLLLTRENDPQRLSTHLAALGIRSASQPIVLYHRAAPGWVGVSGMMLMRPF